MDGRSFQRWPHLSPCGLRGGHVLRSPLRLGMGAGRRKEPGPGRPLGLGRRVQPAQLPEDTGRGWAGPCPAAGAAPAHHTAVERGRRHSHLRTCTRNRAPRPVQAPPAPSPQLAPRPFPCPCGPSGAASSVGSCGGQGHEGCTAPTAPPLESSGPGVTVPAGRGRCPSAPGSHGPVGGGLFSGISALSVFSIPL